MNWILKPLASRIAVAVAFIAGLHAMKAATTQAADTVDATSLLTRINAVGPEGKGHRDATKAWQTLATADAKQIPEILAGMEPKNVLANNWIRSAVETIAARQLATGGKLPQSDLEKFLQDTRNAPRARRVAYELISQIDPPAGARLIAGMLNDPSIELRRDAIASHIAKAEKLEEQGGGPNALAAYRTAFNAARDVDQIKEIAEKLKKLGEQVNLPSHFGFVMNWQLIAPFENVNRSGFDVAYPPESEIKLDATYTGKDNAKVAWIKHTTTDDFGAVDINKTIAKHKGAIAYAYAELVADKPMPVELRLGSTCANKIWLNGELLTANHVYHAGGGIDQYVGSGQLKAGTNRILLKIAQNEQTEEWAQDWQFQLRVCDAIGTAVLSRDRVATTTK